MCSEGDGWEGQSLRERIKAGESLTGRAMQSLALHYDAQMTQPTQEVERLRLEAGALFTAVNDLLVSASK